MLSILTSFVQLAENLKVLGIAIRDLGRDGKAVSKMKSQVGIMKRVTEELSQNAEVCLRAPCQVYRTKY
jgi:hypothetical protein